MKLNAKGFVLSIIKSQLQMEVVSIVNGLGEKNIRWLVENKRPLSSLLPAERERELREKGPKYARVARLVSDEEFYLMVPGWARSLVESYGEQGKEWLARELAWMRTFFGGDDGRREVVLQDRAGGNFRVTRVRELPASAGTKEEPGPNPSGDTGPAGPPGQAPGGDEEDE